MEARTDFAKYPNAAKMARNLIPYPQGGMTRRPGTRHVTEVKTSADATILLDFEFNESTAYMIEHGDLYMRFYKLQARLASANVTSTITNGDFASNITGWDDRSTGSTNATVTITIASPGVVTWTGHGLANNAPIVFTTTDTLPTGITAGTTYYIINKTDDTFQIAAAPLGTAINTSGAQAGTHTGTSGAEIIHDATNSRLQLTGHALGIAWAEQSVTTSEAGTAHTIRFTIDGFGGGKVGFQVGSATVTADDLAEIELGVGEHTITFTPSASPYYIQFRNQAKPVRDMWIDDVSILDNAAVELTSPYAKADLAGLRTFQAADVIYGLHNDYAPRRIERRGDKSWSVAEAFFEDGPWLDENPDTDLDERQILENPFFENGLTGWVTNASGASSYISHDPTDDTITFNRESGAARIQTSASVDTSLTHVLHVQSLALDTIQSTVSLKALLGTSASGSQYSSNDLKVGWNSIEVTPSSSSTLHIELVHDVSPANHDAQVGAVLLFDETAKLMRPSDTTGLVTVTALGHTPFAAADVRRLIRLAWPGREPGYGVITEFTSTDIVKVLVLRDFPSTTPTEGWRLGAWGGDQGYPRTAGLFDARLVLARTTEKPQTLWFSQTNDLQNMRPDSFASQATAIEDDDAIAVTLSGKKINPIFWISGETSMIVGTAGGQWIIDSTSDVITPSGIRSRQHSFIPSADFEPANVNNITLFADKSKREIYDIVFSDLEKSFVPTDLTILADHIFRSPVAEIVYQRRPYSMVWGRRDDGRVSALSYNRQHEVLGWAQTLLGGTGAAVKSVAIIPGNSDSSQTNPSDERDEVWMIVSRTINGATVQYIEFMEYFFDGVLREDYDDEDDWQAAMRTTQTDAIYLDSAITVTNAPASTAVSGLTHLEGETVKVLADGAVLGDEVVASGAITIDKAASTIQVGLPYRHRYESLKLAVGSQGGTSVNKTKIISGCGYIILDSGKFSATTVDYNEFGRRQHDLKSVAFLKDGMDPSLATPLFSGEKTISLEGSYSNDARLYIESDEPLPFTILGLAPLVKGESKPSRS